MRHAGMAFKRGPAQLRCSYHLLPFTPPFFSSWNAGLLGLDMQQLLHYNKRYAPRNLEQEEGRSLSPL